jgi:hypothetical protein
MKLKKWLENWDMTKLKVTTPFLEAEWEPQEKDREAAWELYIVTQPLPLEHGDEETALQSAHALFGITREILRRKGRDCVQFTKIAVIVLNQIVRPFTAKWHRLSINGAFKDSKKCLEFRSELIALQKDLCIYTRMLADVAQVEDLTGISLE